MISLCAVFSFRSSAANDLLFWAATRSNKRNLSEGGADFFPPTSTSCLSLMPSSIIPTDDKQLEVTKTTVGPTNHSLPSFTCTPVDAHVAREEGPKGKQGEHTSHKHRSFRLTVRTCPDVRFQRGLCDCKRRRRKSLTRFQDCPDAQDNRATRGYVRG